MKKDILDWLPIIVVFVAGFFALHQIKSNNITNARLKWLENIKLLIAEFFAENTDLLVKEGISRALFLRMKDQPKIEKHHNGYDTINMELASKLSIINLKHDLIKMNLNPREAVHVKFERELDTYMDKLNEIPKCNMEEYMLIIRIIDAHSERLINISRYMIKLDWEQTKRSSISYWLYEITKGKKIRNEVLNM